MPPKIPLFEIKAPVKKHSEAPVCCGWVTAALVLHWCCTEPGEPLCHGLGMGRYPWPKSSCEQVEKWQVMSEIQFMCLGF